MTQQITSPLGPPGSLDAPEKEPEGVVVKSRLRTPAPSGMIFGFPPDMYRDHGTYYELLCAQRSAGWHQERKGRVTASNFGTAAGHSEYKTRLELMREMAGLQKPKDFAFFQRRAMDLGVALEPYVRDWYEGEYKRKVIERGLVVPKWCMRIGVSVDGWIENPDDGKKRQQGIIEIKCPTNMYPQLVDHSHRIQKGEKFPEFYHLHIKPEHYDQMQGGMAILDADYCDYIVYVDKTKDIYPTRIMRDRKYWNEELYPKLLSFVVEMDEMIEKSKDDAVSPLTDQA